MKDLINVRNVIAALRHLADQKAQIKYEGPGFIIYHS